jgi:uncharacterized protein (TIGR03083 family)
MNDKIEKISKAEMMGNIHRERHLFEEALSKLKQDDMLKPTLAGGWTVKDVLAHLISWEQLMVKWINISLEGGSPADRPQDDADIDRMNAEIYADNQNRDLVGILREFKFSHEQALQVIEGLSEDDLNEPDRFACWQGRPLWLLIFGNTWEHYQEHRQDIEIWLSKKK